MMSKDTTLLVFPCDFPIKIMGDHSPEFIEGIISILQKHYPNTPEEKITLKTSEKGNFVSVSAVVYCTDKITLDALYMELTRFPGIKMVL